MNIRSFAGLLLVVWMLLVAVVPTHAAKPEFYTIEVDDAPYVITQCPGFNVLIESQGRIRVSTHFDKNGNFVKEISR